jgi:hypothetical protein
LSSSNNTACFRYSYIIYHQYCAAWIRLTLRTNQFQTGTMIVVIYRSWTTRWKDSLETQLFAQDTEPLTYLCEKENQFGIDVPKWLAGANGKSHGEAMAVAIEIMSKHL